MVEAPLPWLLSYRRLGASGWRARGRARDACSDGLQGLCPRSALQAASTAPALLHDDRADALAFLSPELGSGQTKRKGWSRNRPYLATVSAVEGLCALRGPDDKNTGNV